MAFPVKSETLKLSRHVEDVLHRTAFSRALAVAFAGLGLGLALPLSAAHAADGTLTVTPSTGFSNTPITVTTSGQCPAGDFVVVRLLGKGFPAEGVNVVGISSASVYPKTAAGGIAVPLQDHLQSFASDQSPPVVLAGKYDIVVICKAKLAPQALGQFSGSVWFTSPTDYRDTDPKSGPPRSLAPPATLAPTEDPAALFTADPAASAGSDRQTTDGTETSREPAANLDLSAPGVPANPASTVSTTARSAKAGTGNGVGGIAVAFGVGALVALVVARLRARRN